LAVGTDLSWAAEGHDAVSIVFNDGQKALIGNVTAAASKPVIVVTFTATPLDLTEVLSNPKVGAVLHVGMPSVQTLGIGDLLFGKRVPSGKTVQTILPASYAAEISIFDFNMRPGPSTWPRPDCTIQPPTNCPLGTNPGRTYRFYTGTPVVPFGFGLSYTSFTYTLKQTPDEGKVYSLDPLRQLLKETMNSGRYFPKFDAMGAPFVEYVISITNTGDYDAEDAVLGFITPPGAGTNGVPLKYLFGFDKVHVPRGQTVSLSLYPTVVDFSIVNSKGDREPNPGQYRVEFGIPETSQLGQGYASHILTVA